jgi:REP element-mobilizing transposase RayT
MRCGVWNLRTRRCFEPILGAMIAAARRPEFHVVHHSVQGNHIHFIVEATSKEHLSRGMQALCIRIALGLARVMGRKGRVFADRYHAHILKTPSEVANAIRYVLGNRVIHVQRLGRQLDVRDFNSRYETTLDVPFTEPATWLLRQGWQRGPRLRLWSAWSGVG